MPAGQAAPAVKGKVTAAGSAEPARRRAGGAAANGRMVLAWFIGLALAVVVVAPIALSSGDLVEWARSPRGLGLEDPWPAVVFVALDCAAAVCVGFVVFNAWMGEGAGTFGLLVWLFAGGSAVANYRHGLTTSAPDDAVFFAGMSLAGPLLLHTTVHRIRRWVRTDAGEYVPRRAHFGLRWLPGVAFVETWEAWRESIRSGIPNPAEAVVRVRERRYLEALGHDDQVRYAAGACGSHDPSELRRWLLGRGLTLDPDKHERALSQATSPTAPAPGGRPRPQAARQGPSRPAPAARPAPAEAGAELARLQERVEQAFLEREVCGGEELVGSALARELDGDDRRKRRVQEALNQLRNAPTPGQRARIAAARANGGPARAEPPLPASAGGRP